ncbi:MAG TPA: SPOR domain-containing protein, partial [Bdellovibrionota bacterium]|nr:SPOR domain-containing protein [Bdellovibrionota bacterium]
LFQELHEEVGKSGVQLSPGRQVKLPQNSVADAKGKPQAEAAPHGDGTSGTTKDSETAAVEGAGGKFTLQVGSYPAEAEAKTKAADLEKRGLHPFIRSAELPGKGRWYRVYLGGYASEGEAQKDGLKHRQAREFDSFIVARMPH